jgi:methylthioribulose-1-phosphate dehydratase
MTHDLAGSVPGWAAEAIIRAGRRMDSRQWVPATAGNISLRLADGRIAITRSGGHKGFLTHTGVMTVDAEGRALTQGARPSAETLLHCQIYATFPGAGAVLHGHSIPATVLSMTAPEEAIRLAGYEVLKAFEGQATHDVALDLPLFDNDQDMPRLARAVAPHLPDCVLGYLIRGHGVYVWGPDMDTALARLEGLEFLLACELERRKLK